MNFPRKLSALAASAAGVLALAISVAEANQNVIFHSQLDSYPSYSNIWGYTAPDGREYALLGATTGLSVVNVSNPEAPYETGFFPGVTSTWREVASYGRYVYVVTEGGGGLVIVDLLDPENPAQLANYLGFETAHTVRVDEATARCFINGSDLGNGGIRILSLANPAVPVEIGSWEVRYVHDCYVKGTRLYAACIFDGRLDILNLTSVPPPAGPLATITGYPSAFTHNCWTTTDGTKVMTTDETTASSVRLWDVSALPATPQTDAYRAVPTAPIPHNVHIDGNLAFISHYTLGVKIVDVSNPADLLEVGSYDTYLPADDSAFHGCWGVFPYFGTHPNLFVASDMSGGLFVLEYSATLGGLEGQVTDAESPGTPVVGANVALLPDGPTRTTPASGNYLLLDDAGPYNLQVSAFGFVTSNIPVSIVAADTVTANVALDRAPGGSITGLVRNASTSAPISGAKVEVLVSPLSVTTPGSGAYSFGNVPVGSYIVRASAFGYNVVSANVIMNDASALVVDFNLAPAVLASTFETGTAGWVVTGITGTNVGRWELGDPAPTSLEGGAIQTGDDHTPAPGVNAWITGLSSGLTYNSNDVDGGATILTSPIFSTIGMTAPRVSYWRWYVTGVSVNTTTDFWSVELSTNGGASWSFLENTDISSPAWVNVDAALGPPSGLTQFRFTARDTAAGSIVEAGLDDFMIYETSLHSGTSVPSGTSGGGALELARPIPNPFRGGQETTFLFSLPSEAPVVVRVYDVAGRRVATLLEERLLAGAHRVEWNGATEGGGKAPSGVYFVRLTTPDGEATRRTLFLR